MAFTVALASVWPTGYIFYCISDHVYVVPAVNFVRESLYLYFDISTVTTSVTKPQDQVI